MSIKQNITSLQNLLEQVNALPEAGGMELPELTNEGSASDLLSGKQLIDQDGNVVTGNIPTKTVSNLTVSGATVTVPSGYYASQVTKSVDSVTQATPSISIDSSGKITATTKQEPGYVVQGTKSATKQLTTQAAKTITPSTSSQIVVESGVYTTGAIIVDAIPSKYKDTSIADVIASDILDGKKGFNSDGEVTGTMPDNGTITSTMDGIDVKSVTIPKGYTSGGTVSLDDTIDNEVNMQTNLITQIISTLENKATGEVVEITLQDKTIIPTASSQTVVADSGYDGLSSVIVTGDANLVAENIVSGKSIFGIIGNAEIGTGGSVSSHEDEILDGSLVNYTNTTLSKIRDHAFEGCTSLKTVNFTECSHIGQEAFVNCTSLTTASFENCLSMASSAFQGCTKLATISFPVCKSVYWKAFNGCKSLTTLDLPSCTYIGGYAFQGCSKLATLSLPLCRAIYSSTFQSCSALTTVSLPAISMIGSTAFGNCKNLKTFYLPGSILCTISGSNVFTSAGITSTSGSIYVNTSLVDSYKFATNWAYFSNIIYPIE